MKKERVADGIYKRTTDAGSSSFICRFKVDGKTYERGLGSTKDTTLREAKLRYAQIIAGFKKPRADEKTFGDLIDRAADDITEVRAWKNPASERAFRRALAVNCKPIHGKKIGELSVDDVLSVLKPMWSAKPAEAKRTRIVIKSVVQWAELHDLRDRGQVNPASWEGCLEFYLPSLSRVHTERHHTAASVEQAREIVAKCMANPDGVSLAIILAVATVCRTAEVISFDHADVDGDIWYVAPEVIKTKKDKPYRIPLSTLARWAMERLRDTPMEGLKGGRMTSSKMLKRLKSMGFDVTTHGFRSSFRDWCAENDVPDDVAEKCLMHKWGNSVTAAYYRSDRLESRRVLMERWAQELLGTEPRE